MAMNDGAACWTDVYAVHRDQLFVAAISITGRRELAEDAIHEAFVNLCTRRPDAANRKAYAFQAVRNSARMIVRARRRAGGPDGSAVLDDEIAVDVDPAPMYADDSETVEWIRTALRQLPDVEREVVVLHVLAELTFQETAEVVGRPLGTVTSSYRRAIEKIRQTVQSTRHQEMYE
jgi:RNA polymerase sigma-70 factor (ECF subfamily)